MKTKRQKIRATTMFIAWKRVPLPQLSVLNAKPCVAYDLFLHNTLHLSSRTPFFASTP